MPLWKIYHPVDAFSAQDKRAMAERITSIYAQLPKFYVGVVFQEVSTDNFYIGGEPADDFVRIWVDHIARQFSEESMKGKFLKAVSRLLSPYLGERDLRWEMHVDETPFSLWSIEGLRPPLPDSVAEVRWKTDNRATAYAEGEGAPAG
ncbi:tautomerase family protein [Caulobacter sp. KR2-114]|uniref:tautomerase family protein n=1 Tax=Caulobacter sp. KR2-114 TaxID=3400912 RepID=UPI003C0F81CF